MKASDSKYRHCLYFVANALGRRIEKLAIESWKKVDLSPSHAYLLMLAIENPGIQPTALSEQLILTPSTITRLIEKLEGKGLVIRNTEGKQTLVYPTDKAKELYPVLLGCITQFVEDYSSILGKEESVRMVENMACLADKLGD
ncbi:MarR family winged helix-turn-helix transcriptional regulator [Paraflavitalea speifideaquila]|uniref:MarR family winged helix-turn-helix transcriptional regulator n=1 Tax=Paraflavitalea speifideaquila TaxID=3076558 RepID=UPI0028EDDFD1|nr:MarR family transcriptional regulator [Paraflavitalea speifideiaquila]